MDFQLSGDDLTNAQELVESVWVYMEEMRERAFTDPTEYVRQARHAYQIVMDERRAAGERAAQQAAAAEAAGVPAALHGLPSTAEVPSLHPAAASQAAVGSPTPPAPRRSTAGASSPPSVGPVGMALSPARLSPPAAAQRSLTQSQAPRGGSQSQNCRVCYSERVDTVLIPCGHLCCCSSCAGRLTNCPICRQSIRSTVHTYIA